MKHIKLAAAFAVLAAPAVAQQGNAENGESAFNRQCVSCHVIANDSGETLAGRNARTGPNLYGMNGQTIGGRSDFTQYGDAIVALGAAGETWTEANFVGYVMDPTGWLREALDDRRARGRMAFQVRNESDAYDIYAYISSLTGQ